ncbi:MAG: NFACT RNA binding domain-containing protein [Candidatus Marinarcus sp.]|uniref:NFACT RNA binding domain-containing protein n=1 Tax=Candidatus Marinarcus sp. TaxID=3100987 RepID=UPI003B00BEA4
MKYYILKAIVDYLQEHCTAVKLIKRVDNNTIIIEFNNKNSIYFDLSKSNALIYKKEDTFNTKKDYNAPFDVVLQKRFYNSKIENISLLNDDKVICIEVLSQSSYKSLKTKLQLEFTGKYTNIIITDEKSVVLEALRHIDEYSSSRVVKVGMLLSAIPKPDFIPKMENIENIEAYLYGVYEKKEQQELDVLKKLKRSQITKQLQKIENLLNGLAQQEELELESQEFYNKANLILSNMHNIKPYQSFIEVFDFEGNVIKMALDLKYPTPSGFANHLFAKAKKAKQKAKKLYLERDNLEQKAQFLKRMLSQIEEAKSIDEIEFLFPKKERNQTKTKKQEPYESFFFQGYKILLGTSERENVHLLQNSKASDFWFHLKERPSSHVIVQNSKKTIPDEVIEKAAKICAQFSVDFEGNYLVDYTQRRNVKIQSGANVLYNPYSTVTVKV